jgi:hypothetical protein
LSCGVCDRYAERGVDIQYGGADLEFGDLAIEVACHEALPQQLHAMHIRLGAASAVVSAPLSPDRAAEVFRCAKGLIPHDGARGRRLPRFGVPTRRYDGMSASVSDGITTLARVVGPVCMRDCRKLSASRAMIVTLTMGAPARP